MKQTISRTPYFLLLIACVLLLLAGCGGDDESAASSASSSADAITVPGALPWQQIGDSDLKVLSANTYPTGSGEYVYLVGEVENTTDQPLTAVKITANGYNDQGQVFETEETETLIDTIAPGQKAPFSAAMDARDIERYELDVTSEAASAAPAYQLEIVDPSETEPKSGYVWFEGEVSNTGNVAVDKVRVVAVLYDQDGKVVEVASQDLKDPLAVGDKAAFKFIANHRGSTSYELLVTASEAQ
ncbi:MAG: FxLYD domain-containing protein [Caldilineaceae bacterium]